MEVDFVKISPTQNMTILVTSPLDRAEYRDLAEKIMAYDNVYAEQVGFVEKALNPQALARLQMTGGEFCGNASLALCAYLVWKGLAESNDECTVPIEVSGLDEVLYCDIKKVDNFFLGKIKMPVPDHIKDYCVEIMGKNHNFPVVYMPGISHVIVDTELVVDNMETIVDTLLLNFNSITKEDALGVMFYEKKHSCIKPFVYVKTAGTMVWERGCGSGTAALGAYLAHCFGKNVKVGIAQPGGTITAEADIAEGRIINLTIEGKIMIVAEGKAFF